MEDAKEKFKKLVEHWIEHTKEHAEEFSRWAEKVESLGLGSEAKEVLNKASSLMQEVVKTLEKLQ
ncbi:MAG: hypothetical protein GXO57_03080 [Thermodesulfobacteria bacterium]|nr:hypothetical protein [Thermodesulfobacteriota bacterium]